MYPTIILNYQSEIANVEPAGIPMTLPVHADRPAPIHVPQQQRHPNPANRLAFQALRDMEPCGKCGASPLAHRIYKYHGVVVLICAVCGWDSGRRAGEGMPDQCGRSPGLFDKPCDELQPCNKHG